MRERRATMAKLIGSVWEIAGSASPEPAGEKASLNIQPTSEIEVQETTARPAGVQRKAVIAVTTLLAMVLLAGTTLAKAPFSPASLGQEQTLPRLLQPEQFPVKLLPPGLTNPAPQFREPEGNLHRFTPDKSPADNFR